MSARSIEAAAAELRALEARVDMLTGDARRLYWQGLEEGRREGEARRSTLDFWRGAVFGAGLAVFWCGVVFLALS